MQPVVQKEEKQNINLYIFASILHKISLKVYEKKPDKN